jgi:hypothetical protein
MVEENISEPLHSGICVDQELPPDAPKEYRLIAVSERVQIIIFAHRSYTKDNMLRLIIRKRRLGRCAGATAAAVVLLPLAAAPQQPIIDG